MGTAPLEASGSGNGSSSGAALAGPESAARQALSPILPFLGPIEELLLDPAVTEIMVNAADDVYVERLGVLEPADVPGWTNRELERALVQIARSLDSDISAAEPLLDARLPDGSRVAGVLPPVSEAPMLTIRKHAARAFTVAELVESGTLPPGVLEVARHVLAARGNILIAGSTGSGKTTLLRALLNDLEPGERYLVIEDTAEINLDQPHARRLEARRAAHGRPAVTIRDLVRASLRHRPDRLVVGEVRGPEAWDLLQALNTGHGGAISTIHANTAEDALMRLATCALMQEGSAAVPWPALAAIVGAVTDLVVHVARWQGVRMVGEALRVHRYDPGRQAWETETVWPPPAERERTA